MALPFTVEDAVALRRSGRLVSARRAHKVLHRMRAENTAQDPAATWHGANLEVGQEVVDMTDGDFDWRGYIANRPPEQLQELVGDGGITRFEMRFVEAWDRNMSQRRCDFIAIRSDGLAVRFHPASTGDSVPVVGHLESWVIGAGPHPPALGTRMMERARVDEGAPAASQGPADATNSVFRNLSQADLINRKEAQAFLDDKERRWHAAWNADPQGPRPRFCEDLTSSTEFPWRHFLAGFDWGRELCEEGVESFWLVWLGGDHYLPAFYVRQQDGHEWVIRPRVVLGTRSDDAVCLGSIDWR